MKTITIIYGNGGIEKVLNLPDDWNYQVFQQEPDYTCTCDEEGIAHEEFTYDGETRCMFCGGAIEGEDA